MKTVLAYVNEVGVSCIVNMPSVMKAVETMDAYIKSRRVNIVFAESGEPEDIQACVILQSGEQRLVYAAKPDRYTFNTVETRAYTALAYVYEVMIKIGSHTFSKKTNDSTKAAAIYVHGLHAGYPVFMKRNGELVAADNCGTKWASYSIHANGNQRSTTLVPRTSVIAMPEPESEYVPDIDIDTTLDEMNDLIGDLGALDNIEI